MLLAEDKKGNLTHEVKMGNKGHLRAGIADKSVNVYFCPNQFPLWKGDIGGKLQSIDDRLLFEAAAGKLKQRFLDTIKLVCS